MTVDKICCNQCGREIGSKNGMLKEDVFEGSKEWGFFSDKDLELHKFYLCESCYDELISKFKIPVQMIKITEVL